MKVPGAMAKVRKTIQKDELLSISQHAPEPLVASVHLCTNYFFGSH